MRQLLRKAHDVSQRVETDVRHLLGYAPREGTPGGEERRPTVLLVEDDTATCGAMEAWLSLNGFSVRTAASGSEAAEQLDDPEEAIDVAVVDIGLPDVNGVTLCEMMQAFHPFLPVLVCSGRATSEDVGRLRAAGVRHFFSKPVAPDELVTAVESALT
jgi:DNA-binding response OmpR family regulator